MSTRNLADGESLIPAIERDFPELSGWWEGTPPYLLLIQATRAN